MTKWKTFFTAKKMLILCCLLLLFSAAGLLLLDPSFLQQPQTVSYSVQGTNQIQREARYYPGQGETSFLLAVPQGGFSHKVLLRALLAQGYPTLLVEYPSASGQDAAGQSACIEAESQLLTTLSGNPSDKQVWIGFHSGADAILEQMVLGQSSCQASLILAPDLANGQVDDAIIVDGNYQNRSEWIQSLTPEMVRQPVLLMTSNGDDRSTPYQMTLLYNKFSSDTIIHMGGVYHANRNDVYLTITDSAFHDILPFHYETLNEVSSFLRQATGSDLLPHSPLWRLQNALCFVVCAFLLFSLGFAARLAPHFAPPVSFSMERPFQVKETRRLFAALGLSFIAALVCLLFWWIIVSLLQLAALYLIAGFLLCFSVFRRVFLRALFGKKFVLLRAAGLPVKKVLLSVLTALISAAAITVLFFQTFPQQPFGESLTAFSVRAAVCALALFLFSWEALFCRELLGGARTPLVYAGLYATLALPIGAVLALICIFTGESAIYWSLCLIGALAVCTLVSRISYCLCGHPTAAVLGLIAVLPAFPYLMFLV